MNDRQMRLFKRAFMPLTPQAQQAAADPNAMPPGGAPMDPNAMPPQGAPMDPSMQGAPMDPNAMPPGGAPMDPSMQGGAPMDPNSMPPQGAPMDPNAQGGAPVSTGDPIIDMIMQLGGVIIDGTSGQPIPPEIIAQMVQEAQAQGFMPGPQDPNAAPMDPNAMPPEQGQPNPDIAALQESVAQVDKTVSTVLDKIDALRNVVDSLLSSKEKSSGAAKDADEMDADVRAVLEEMAQQQAPQEAPQEAPMPPEQEQLTPEQMQQLQLLDAMQQQGVPMQ